MASPRSGGIGYKGKPVSLCKPDFLEIVAGTSAVDDEEGARIRQHQQRMMPDVARIVDALLPRRGKRAVARGHARIGAHQDQPRLLVQGHEELAAKRMALHQLDQDRTRPQRTVEQTDVDRPALLGDVDPSEAVETL